MNVSPPRPVHSDNQQMLVIFNSVHPHQRSGFQQFVNQVFVPAVASLDTASRCTVRLLEPSLNNADGSCTYVMLIDPAFQTGGAPVHDILTHAYGPDRALEHIECYSRYLADQHPQSILADKD